MAGRIICYQCDKKIGTHAGNGDTHGLCKPCQKQAIIETRKAQAEYLKRKESKK